MKNRYCVYALVKDGRAVYIGCTSNKTQRQYQHRKNKDFDKLVVIKSFKDKKTALAVENGIITFLTLFGDGEWYNAENILVVYERFYLREQ